MNILVVNLGSLVDCFISSSINHGLIKKYDNPEITWVIKTEEISKIFKYNPKIKKVYLCSDFITSLQQSFDLLINLDTLFTSNIKSIINIKNGMGFNFSDQTENWKEMLYGDKQYSMNQFQFYYKVAGMSWRGEGYDIAYYPRTKCKRNRLGIGIVNTNLRDYVSNNLFLPNLKKYHIPYKRNILRKMDEINKCSKIITDDYLMLNMALSLRKYVYFLQTTPRNFKIEFFRNGEIQNISHNIESIFYDK